MIGGECVCAAPDDAFQGAYTDERTGERVQMDAADYQHLMEHWRLEGLGDGE